MTNTFALGNLVTNFTFTPGQATNYCLEARAVLFTEFPLAWGPFKRLATVTGPPTIVMAAPAVARNQVQLNFTATGGPLSTFHLIQADVLGQVWIINGEAVLTTNILGSAYRFTTTNGPAKRFYKVQSP